MAANAVNPKGELNTNLQIAVWHTVSGNERFSIRLPYSNTWACELSPNGNRLVAQVVSVPSSLEENSIKIWDVDTGKVMWESEKFPGPLNDLKFSPDGRRILGRSESGIMGWDAEIGRLLWNTQGENTFSIEEFSDDSKQLIRFIQAGRIVFMEVDSGRELRSVDAPTISRSA